MTKNSTENVESPSQLIDEKIEELGDWRVVKLTFFKGASLKDPSALFNSSLEGKTRRAIDLHEDDEIDEKAFVILIRAAVSLNESSSR
jgi:hypothetical protein